MNTIKTNRRARQSGTTLIELSVVIAVILLLVGVLFIGVTAWKNGANRAACLVNLATLQKAVRGYQNVHSDAVPALTQVPIGGLVADQYFAAMPACPAGGAYAPDNTAAVVPFPAAAPNNVAFTCPNAAALNHAPQNTN